MITCNNISKSYNKQLILKNFSYKFESGKIYFLYGRSGSGKTTLLNILCGLLNFDSGCISYDFLNTKYCKKVDNEEIHKHVAYISQNTFFIKYLSVYENLKICNDDIEMINELLQKFELEHLKDKVPDTLSGGEKQRLAIIQALLMNKKILLLDEPTASLDKRNKLKFFELLADLKGNLTIVISSHDLELKSYCDEIINFEKLDAYLDKKKSAIKPVEYIYEPVKKTNIIKYMLKQFSYSKYEKKETILLYLVFSLTILICFLCGFPEKKLLSNLERKYKVNQIQLNCNENNQQFCDLLLSEKSIKEVVIDYSSNLEMQDAKDGMVFNYDYDITAQTLPFKRDNFRLADKLLYGNYFENKNDIILTFDYAESISNGQPIEHLIDKEISLKLQEGEEVFKICGIFDKFDKNDYMYFEAMGVYKENLSKNVFLNSEFTNGYFKAPRHYVVFFDSFSSMNKVYEKYIDMSQQKFISSYENIYVEIFATFSLISYLFYPIGIVGLIVTLLFYFQSLISKLEYYRYNYCTYNYYGYSNIEVKKAYFISNLLHIVKILCVSTILSIFLSFLLNYINDLFLIFPYELFQINIMLLLAFCVLVFIVSIIALLFSTSKVSKMGWYNMLQESRDLL